MSVGSVAGDVMVIVTSLMFGVFVVFNLIQRRMRWASLALVLAATVARVIAGHYQKGSLPANEWSAASWICYGLVFLVFLRFRCAPSPSG